MRRSWVSMVRSTLACCLVATLGAAAHAQPAVDLFDEAVYFLSLQYCGFSEVPPQVLAPAIREDLVQRCDEHAACPETVGVEAIERLIARLDDPHTAYLPPEAFVRVGRLMGEGARDGAGIGLQVASLEARPGLVVLRALAGGPGASGGLRRGDVIVALDGDPLPLGPPAAARLRRAGADGGTLRLTVERALDRRFTVELVPSPHPVRPSFTMLGGGIGLIDVPSFFASKRIGPAVHELVRDAQEAGAQALVIDLRSNPGGLLPESLVAEGAFASEPARRVRSRRNVTDWVFRDGTLYVETSQGQSFAQYDVPDPARFDGRVAVLVDADTASAAEFLAAGLQDVGALVVGEPTFGGADTGTGFIGLSNGGGLQITTGRIERRDGRPYPPRVEPDVHVEQDLEALARGEDAARDEAVARLEALGASTRGGPSGNAHAASSRTRR